MNYTTPHDREELHDRLLTGELKYVIPKTGIKMVKPAHLRENMDPRAITEARMIDLGDGGAATACIICGRCEDTQYCYLCQTELHSHCMDGVDLEVALSLPAGHPRVKRERAGAIAWVSFSRAEMTRFASDVV